jgi:organic hydroperoxide reductase OsmC/OhrA
MGATRLHRYEIASQWTGNRGTGTSGYAAYSRDYQLGSSEKTCVIPGSSDPLFRGDKSRYNPEELLVAALSACHMLWVLHLCADAGIVILEYADTASGEVVEHADGSAEFTRVVLRPRMRLADPGRSADALAVHDRARQVCCLARSVNFPVDHEPAITP